MNKKLFYIFVVALLSMQCTSFDDQILSNEVYCSKGNLDNIEQGSYAMIDSTEYIHYALSVLGRVEQQLLLFPNEEYIDYGRFDYSWKMFLKAKHLHCSYNTADIPAVCNNNVFFNKYAYLDKSSDKHRKEILRDNVLFLLQHDEAAIVSFLNDFFSNHRRFVDLHRKEMLHSYMNRNTTRNSAGEYKIELLTPVGLYNITCNGDMYVQEAAELNGIDLPYSCRCGGDGASAAIMTKGSVDMPDNLYLSQEEIGNGYILLDIAYPTSDCTIYTNKENDLLIERDLPEIVVTGEDLSDHNDPFWDNLSDIDWNSISGEWPTEGSSSDNSGMGGNGGTNSPGNEEYQQYPNILRLTTPEEQFIKKYPIVAISFLRNANLANKKAASYYNNLGARNGVTDAFRHMLWSAYNCYDCGFELAKEFGDAHEASNRQTPAEKRMDLYNNAIGYQIGGDALSEGRSKDELPNIVFNNMNKAMILE